MSQRFIPFMMIVPYPSTGGSASPSSFLLLFLFVRNKFRTMRKTPIIVIAVHKVFATWKVRFASWTRCSSPLSRVKISNVASVIARGCLHFSTLTLEVISLQPSSLHDRKWSNSMQLRCSSSAWETDPSFKLANTVVYEKIMFGTTIVFVDNQL